MYRPVVVTPPSIKPVTRTEAKAALDIGYTDKDTLIDGLIAAATTYLDGWTGILGRALCEQTLRQDYDAFCTRLRLPLSPVISITSVKHYDTAGVQQTITSTNYTLKNDDLGPYVEFISTYAFPALYVERASVSVTYLAGYATVTGAWTGPDAIKQAMLLLIRQWFDNPTPVIVGQTVEKMPYAVDALLAPFRRQRF
jgi:uncharacterized phiE125 gp8 family phage protein